MREAPLPPILCISDGDWDALLPTNRQQLIKRLAAYTPVFVATTPRSVTSTFVGKSQVRHQRHRITIEDGIYVYKTTGWLPHTITRRSKILSRWADWAFCQELTHAYQPLDWPRPILWLYPPDAGNLLGIFNECLSVYHYEDHASVLYNRYSRVAPYNERKTLEHLIRQVDLVITATEPLYERCKRLNSCTMLIHTATDSQSWDNQARAIITILARQLNSGRQIDLSRWQENQHPIPDS
jgi:hypothetical protein